MVVSVLIIIAGICYVAFRTAKEGDFEPICGVIAFVVIMGFLYLLASSGLSRVALNIIMIVSPFLLVLLVCIIAYVVEKGKEESKTENDDGKS